MASPAVRFNGCSRYRTRQHSSSVTGARRRDHITPVLRQLHWLPVKQRIDFKLALLVYKSLRGLSLPYLSDDCQLVTEVERRTFTCVAYRAEDTVTDWRQEFYGSLPIKIRPLNVAFEHYKRLIKVFCTLRLRPIVTCLLYCAGC